MCIFFTGTYLNEIHCTTVPCPCTFFAGRHQILQILFSVTIEACKVCSDFFEVKRSWFDRCFHFFPSTIFMERLMSLPHMHFFLPSLTYWDIPPNSHENIKRGARWFVRANGDRKKKTWLWHCVQFHLFWWCGSNPTHGFQRSSGNSGNFAWPNWCSMLHWFRHKFFHPQSNPTNKQHQHPDIAWQNIHFARIKTGDGAKHCVEHSSRCCVDSVSTNISNMVHFRNGRLHEWPGALRSVPQMSSTTSLKKTWATDALTTFLHWVTSVMWLEKFGR